MSSHLALTSLPSSSPRPSSSSSSFLARPVAAREASRFVAATLLAGAAGIEIARAWDVRVSEIRDALSAGVVIALFVASVFVASNIRARLSSVAAAFLLVAHGATLYLAGARLGALFVALAPAAIVLVRTNLVAYVVRAARA